MKSGSYVGTGSSTAFTITTNFTPIFACISIDTIGLVPYFDANGLWYAMIWYTGLTKVYVGYNKTNNNGESSSAEDVAIVSVSSTGLSISCSQLNRNNITYRYLILG